MRPNLATALFLLLSACAHAPGGKRYLGPSSERMADATCNDPLTMADCHIKVRELCGGDYRVSERESERVYGSSALALPNVATASAGSAVVRGLVVKCIGDAASLAAAPSDSKCKDKPAGTGWWHL